MCLKCLKVVRERIDELKALKNRVEKVRIEAVQTDQLHEVKGEVLDLSQIIDYDIARYQKVVDDYLKEYN